MIPAARSPRPRIPAFVPVPTRARHDGWNAARQAGFIGALAETGSVAAPAARVGMRRGRHARTEQKPDNAAVLRWLAVLDRSARECGGHWGGHRGGGHWGGGHWGGERG